MHSVVTFDKGRVREGTCLFRGVGARLITIPFVVFELRNCTSAFTRPFVSQRKRFGCMPVRGLQSLMHFIGCNLLFYACFYLRFLSFDVSAGKRLIVRPYNGLTRMRWTNYPCMQSIIIGIMPRAARVRHDAVRHACAFDPIAVAVARATTPVLGSNVARVSYISMSAFRGTWYDAEILSPI